MLYAENKIAVNELRRNEYIFWGIAVLFCILFLGTDAWWGVEAYFAEAVREMVQDSRFFPPTFNGVQIDGVPLPLLWEGALCGGFFGVSEWTLRLVTVLNALLLLAGTMVLCRRFFDRRAALLAGALLLGSCGFLYTARVFAGVIPAAACGIWAIVLLTWGNGRWRVLRILAAVVFLLFALAFGTFYAVLAPLVAVAILRRGEEKKAIGGWIVLVVIVAVAAYFLRRYCALPPQYPDFSGNFGKDLLRAAGFDAVRVFFPWSLWGIVAIIRNFWTFNQSERNVRSFTVAVAAIWLVLIVPAMENWRQMVYLLPLLSILTAAMLTEERQLSRAERAADLAVRYFIMLAGALAVASLVVIPIWKILFRVEVSPYILWSIPVIGLIAQIFLLFDVRGAVHFSLPPRCGGTVLAAVTLTAAAFCIMRPNFTTLRLRRSFILDKLKPQIGHLPQEKVLYYGTKPDASVLYYIGAPFPFVVADSADRTRVLHEFFVKNAEHFVAVVADVDPAMKKDITDTAANFGLDWENPMAAEKTGRADEKERHLMLFFGNVAPKTEETSITNQEEKP